VYQIEYTRLALKSLLRMPRNVAENIQRKVASLADNPFAHHGNAMKLQGRDGYRLRVGDWRVLYEIRKNQLVILVLDIKPRGGAYQ
jgi:mRNA interferase RelE/StbE